MSVTLILLLVAFGLTIVSAFSRVPLWIAVLLVTLVLLIGRGG